MSAAVASRIRRDILRGRYRNGQILTQQELAENCGQNRLAVHRALRQLKQDGILVTKRGVGTVVRLSKRGFGKREDLRVVLLSAPIRHPFFADFFVHLQRAVESHGAYVALTNESGKRTRPKQADADVEFFGRLQESGINDAVVWPFHGGAEEHRLLRLRGVGWNIVLFDHFSTGGSADCVGLDNADAIARLMKALRERGCRRVHWLGWTHASVPLASTQERALAFEQHSAGFTRAFHEFKRDRNEYRGAIHGLINRLVKERRVPDAFVCVNQEIANVLLESLRTRELRPRVAVVDEMPASDIEVLSIRQPVEKMAKAVFNRLLKQREAGTEWKARIVRMKGTLVSSQRERS